MGADYPVWCDFAKRDQDALQKLLNVKAQQTDQPAIPIITPIWNFLTSAFSQLVAIVKGLFGFD